MGFAAKVLAQEIRRAAQGGDLWFLGEENATGNAQKKLDAFSNQIVMDAFSNIGLVAAIASAEPDQVELIEYCHLGQYIFCFHLGSDS